MENSLFTYVTGTLSHLDEIARLFDQYRMFYKMESNVALARDFIEQRITNKESHIIICVDSLGKAIAFTQIYPVFSSLSCKKDYILNDLFVKPDFRKSGIATRLLTEAKNYVRRNYGKGLALETSPDNPARSIYEKLGWKQDREYLHYYCTV